MKVLANLINSAWDNCNQKIKTGVV